MSDVLVIGKNGKPLMPMKAGGQARILLKKKRAKVVCKDPFTIQLLYENENTRKQSYFEKVGNLFMAKRKVDSSLIPGMMDALKNQPAPNEGFSKSEDPNFPVWKGEVKKQFLVYVPMTPVRKMDDNTLVGDPLITYQHAVHANGSFSSVRCFNGITSEALGWDGVCPLCEAAKECSDEYFTKLTLEAARLGISENQIKDNPALEAVRTKLNNERAVKRAEEFLTFPIVVLTENAQAGLTKESMEQFKAYFFEIRRGTYEDKLIKIIKSQVPAMNVGCPDTPFGKMFTFNYIYDSKGQEPNIRDAVRNVQYVPITNANFYNQMAPYLQYAEQLAAGFTNEKAVEVLKASQIWYKDDYQKMTDNSMLTTRAFLASAKSGGAVPAPNGIAQTLSAFSVNPAAPQIAPTVPTMSPNMPAAPAVGTPAPTLGTVTSDTAVVGGATPTMQAGVAPTVQAGATPFGVMAAAPDATAPMQTGVPTAPTMQAGITPMAPQIGAV